MMVPGGFSRNNFRSFPSSLLRSITDRKRLYKRLYKREIVVSNNSNSEVSYYIASIF